MQQKTFSTQIAGRTLKVELGQLAQQTNGSAYLSYGDSAVLATAVMDAKARERCDYLPLTVEYEEKLYAAGKIKGSRFMKREGRAQDAAILSGRLIDRTIRPRFDQRIRNEIQVAITVLSFDKENDPDILGITAASLALGISNIPWDGPVAGVRVSRVNNQLVINPTYEQRANSDFEITVTGTETRINMLEGSAKEVPEEEILKAIEFGQQGYRELIKFQQKIIAEINTQKKTVPIKELTPELVAKIKDFLKGKIEPAVYAKDRATMYAQTSALSESLVNFIKETEPADTEDKILLALALYDDETNDLVHANILTKERRPDGRKLDEVRPLASSVGILPRTHGSALFNRGATQALSTVTLGAPSEKQIIDGLEEEYKKRFIHHYNFPRFAVGEIGGFRGPGRREIGHGYLAENSLAQVIPDEESFPYTIRVVSEILSSNGSSSMASVCGSSLALMDAGVPIKAAVAGIAMGLILDAKTHQYKVLTDIQGPEDHYGDMDCKVAGTAQGVCGVQMDVKIEGVDMAILKDTFLQARQARLHILENLKGALAAPRPNLSEFAPRILSFQINPEKIREVIGPGGKVINEIVAQTGAKIDIEDTGLVFITAESEQSAQKALNWIKDIVREVMPGEVFNGKVTRIINFGAFVEVLPGQEGLVHISELAPFRVNRVDDIVKVGDSVVVKVKNVDEQGRINLTMKDAKN